MTEHVKRQSFKEAFIDAIPVIVGYVFVGIAFGLMLYENGFSFWWAILSSLIVYAGSLQFVLISFMVTGASLLTVALTTLSVNSRHLFYGITFLDLFKRMGKLKPYMIFTLSDETYSLMAIALKKGGKDNSYYFFVSIINQSFWIIGSFLGGVMGEVIPFNTEGIDFAMTALFTVIFIEQWLSSKSKAPGIMGLVLGLGFLLIMKSSGFIMPALVAASILLLLFEKKEEKV